MRSWMTNNGSPPFAGLGTASMWGKIIITERGWRAEYAYPKEIFLPAEARWENAVTSLEAYVDDLGQYGVPVCVLPMNEILERAAD